MLFYNSHLVKEAEGSQITNTHEFFERPVTVLLEVMWHLHEFVLDFSYQSYRMALQILAETVIYTFVTLLSAYVPLGTPF